jgi:hypothetical protein
MRAFDSLARIVRMIGGAQIDVFVKERYNRYVKGGTIHRFGLG